MESPKVIIVIVLLSFMSVNTSVLQEAKSASIMKSFTKMVPQVRLFCDSRSFSCFGIVIDPTFTLKVEKSK